jgi:serine/threonine protein kinase
MPQPTAAEMWTALARSRLLGPAALQALQREFAQQPAAKGADATAVAKWLIGRGSLTTWQAKRLLAGDRGPYVLGEYRLLDRVEHPGQVPLFSARHDPSGRTVDVVLLSARRCQDPAVWPGIVRRTTAAVAATDPVLSRTWALEQTEAARFIVCEHVDGRPLGAVLEQDGRLPPRTAGALALRIARAVATLHARDEVHGGLSLDAVRLPGSAGAVDPQVTRVLQYPLVGDPHLDPPRVLLTSDEEIARLGPRAAFVAPELTRPDAVCDARSDVYAIGCVLHALLTGQLPGWAGDPRATLRQAATSGVPPLGPPVVPDEVGTLVAYLTARDPDGRYRTAGEAADAIAACFAIEAEPAFAGVGDVVPGLAVATAATPRTARRRPPTRRAFPLGAVSAVIGLVSLGVAATMWLDPFGMRRPAPPMSASEEPAQAPPAAEPAVAPVVVDAAAATVASVDAGDTRPRTAPTAAAPILVDDDGLPWAAPTHGTPLALTYLPNGSQLLLVVRPADILADEEGPRFFKSLGPVVESAATWLTAVSGCGLDGIDSVHAGWQAAADGTVLGACVIRLAGGRTIPDDEGFRTRQWGADGAGQVEGETIHRAGRWSFWTPRAETGRVLVVAPGELVEAVVRGGAEPPMLAGDLETLAEKLDDRRHVTVAAATHFLFTEGRGVFVGPLRRLGDPLETFLGDDVRAVALAAHFGEAFYAEIDAAGTLDASAAGLAPVLRARLDALPDDVEEYVAALAPHPHGRRLVLRLPGMLRALVAGLRSGPEGRAAVLNAYLPRHAGHNLALAGELVLAQSPGAAPLAAAAAAPAPAASAGALERMRKPMTLVFARDTLEKSVQMVAEEAGVPIEINGRDLELEGITKNQSFGLAERDTTADAVLRTILAKSNADGKLVYVVRSQDGAETIEITTRAAAAKRGDTLPPGFAAEQGTEATGEKR